MLYMVVTTLAAWLILRRRVAVRSNLIFVSAVVGILTGAMVAAMVGIFIPVRTVAHHTAIVSIHTSSETSGIFVLGTGSLDGESYYVYYRQDQEGFRRDETNTDDAIVVEQDRQDGEIISYSCEEEDDLLSTLWYFPVRCIDIEDTTRIIVPKGTIIREFKLDS